MKAKDVLKILNITRPTLTKYVKENKIKVDSVINGQYVYNDESVYSLIGLKKEKQNRLNVIYARVSNPPKKYLDEQLKRLINFCSEKGITVDKEYFDIKSGMNFERDQFKDLIQEIVKGNIELIVIENKDRLCRFGFDLFNEFCKYFKTKIIIVNELSEKNFEQELTEDLISIIHYFSMKSYSHRRKLNKIKKELENDND
ncbi:MAG: IS607 family transposase [Clostridia bacterium]|nr:IS607 family transposase [Clostridia bacterium]